MDIGIKRLLERSKDPDQYRQIPGLFRKWELEQLIEPEFEYYIEEYGKSDAGETLYRLFKRKLSDEELPR